MNNILFYIVILVANVIQGITGFAGTILAMPPSIILVGIGTARPILNLLGLYAGIYVLVSHGRHVNWKEVRKVIVVMAFGLVAGIFLKSLLIKQDYILYKVFGVFVLSLAITGLIGLRRPPKSIEKETQSFLKSYSLLITAGIVHGIFVSGGPFLIGYLSKKIKDKESFRATVSTIWIVLNSIILLDDIRNGLWTSSLIKMQFIAIPFLFAGMVIGTWLYSRMSQLVFMKLTYILLFISGISLLIK